jgi:hypothetical protein
LIATSKRRGAGDEHPAPVNAMIANSVRRFTQFVAVSFA